MPTPTSSTGTPGLLLALLLAAIPPAGAESGTVWSRAETAAQARAAENSALADRLERSLATGDSRAVADTVRTIETAPDIHPLAREALLNEAALRLAAQAPAPATRALLERLAQRPPQTYTWLEEEGHHRVAVPVFHTGAAARWALREWRRDEALRTAEAALAAGRLDPTAFSAESEARQGLADALRRAPTTQLHALRESLLQALRSGEPLEEPALVVAARLADSGLFIALLRHGEPARSLDALPLITDSLPPQEAFALLRAIAGEHPYHASAALQTMAGLANAEPRVLPHLLELLGTAEHGASAAAALASLHDPRVIAALDKLLLPGASPARLKHAVLALRLDGSPAARRALDRLAADPRLDSRLRKELGL